MRAPVNREELLLRIQALQFTAIDLGLYLNTHSNDTRALADYNQISAALAQTRAAYEQASVTHELRASRNHDADGHGSTNRGRGKHRQD